MAIETDTIGKRRQGALDRIDEMPADLRSCVHDYGLAVVVACMKYGVKKPNQIRDLVREIWEGPRLLGQRNGPLSSLDWLLIQSGSTISARTLTRVLHDHSHCILPTDPSTAMIEASMSEVSSFNERITKREKHRRRLRAAMVAGVKNLWPDLRAFPND